jgi:RNA polymerase sigma-70 factor (ECF subfamily)
MRITYTGGGFLAADMVEPGVPLLEFRAWQAVVHSPAALTNIPGMSMAEELAPLVYRTALGDQRAFEDLYQQTSPRLMGVALALLRRRDLAEDVLQEAYVKVWHAAGSYRPELGTVGTWLATIVRRSAIDRLRRQKNEGQTLPEPDWDLLEDDGPGPLERMLEDDDARRLSRCLEHLDERQRESVRLAFFHGLTHSELAEKMSAPLGTVKAWVRRGLEKLKGCLHEL